MTTSLLDATSTSVSDTLKDDLFLGRNGLADAIWIDELRLSILEQGSSEGKRYAERLAGFHTQVASYHTAFYHAQWRRIRMLQGRVLDHTTKTLVGKELQSVVLDPIFDRAKTSALDTVILEGLLYDYSSIVFAHAPHWALNSINDALLEPSWASKDKALQLARLLVKFVNSAALVTLERNPLHLSPHAALVTEAIYSGNIKNFDLRSIATEKHALPVLSYPYFITTDKSGGDIEDRSSKATLADLVVRFAKWKKTQAPRYISATHRPQIPHDAVSILKSLMAHFPKLVLVHPELFLAYASLSFGQTDLETKAKIDAVLDPLKVALGPQREGESGNRWGWAPPLMLGLTFAKSLLTDTANEVADGELDDQSNMGVLTCKLAGVNLLEWWADTYYNPYHANVMQLVQSMERSEGRQKVMKLYDEIRGLALAVDNTVIRQKASRLSDGSTLLKASAAGLPGFSLFD